MEGTKTNPEFVLNYQQYQFATILLARKNHGCGSTREHAPWALADYGIKVMIAPSFADIFYNNSLNNHMLPIRLSEEEVEEIFQWVWANESKQIHVDLEAMTVTVADKVYTFELDEFRRHCLLNGLDNIGLTTCSTKTKSQHTKKIFQRFTSKIKNQLIFHRT